MQQALPLSLLASTLAALLAPSAPAQVELAPGKLAFVSSRHGHEGVYTVDTDGGGGGSRRPAHIHSHRET